MTTLLLFIIATAEPIAFPQAATTSKAKDMESSTSLVLSSQKIGALPLGKGATISEQRLRRHFPQYDVSYEIGYGDSPNFHYFQVRLNGELLFSIQSFIDGGNESKTSDEVPIDLVVVHSRKVPDSFGLRVGDRVADILKKRGKDLKFGPGHFDALIGAGDIFYSLNTDTSGSPERLTMGDAIKGNWKIRLISWPQAAWE